MIEGRKVVVFIPYGREETVSVLLPYLRRDYGRGLIDEVWLCMNTDPHQVSDITYAIKLSRVHPWIAMVDRPVNLPRLTPKQRNTGYFYRLMTEPETVYVRMDDDIVYVHEDMLVNLVTARIAMHSSTLTAFPIIWNNAVCSWFLQQHGKIPGPPSWPAVSQPYCMDPIGWADPDFAIRLHKLLLDTLELDEPVDKFYLYQDIPLAPRQQFSVSCFAVMGSEYAALTPPGVLDYPEEEHWHTVHRPMNVAKDNVIVGNALVSHYTFYPQGAKIRQTNILDRYRALAVELDRSL